MAAEFTRSGIGSEPLCVVDFKVAGTIMPLGQSPWRNRKVGYIADGVFSGPRMSGVVLPGGGDWSEGGKLADGSNVTFVDARSVWRTDDGALIYVTYTGRGAIPDDVVAEFADPDKVEDVDPSRYYIATAPVFETSDARYSWLNGVLAVGYGRRIRGAIRYEMFQVK